MKQIPLSKGMFAVVDDEDFEKLSQYRWYAHGTYQRKHLTYYAVTTVGKLRMHRLVMDCQKGSVVDHLNHDTLDNRKDNLRICTAKQNLYNRRQKVNKKHKSEYLGVFPSLKKWYAAICVEYKRHYLGTFETAEEAARIYDIHARAAFGEFANLNFKT